MKRKNKIWIITVLSMVFFALLFLFLTDGIYIKGFGEKILYQIEYDENSKRKIIKEGADVEVKMIGEGDNAEASKAVYASKKGWVKYEGEDGDTIYFINDGNQPVITRIVYKKGNLKMYYKEFPHSDTVSYSFLVKIKTNGKVKNFTYEKLDWQKEGLNLDDWKLQ